MLIARINIVHTPVKTKFLQIRISENIKHDLQIVAELRGLSTSALIHSLIVKTIRAEKEREPKAFEIQEDAGIVTKDEKEFKRTLDKHKPIRRTDQ